MTLGSVEFQAKEKHIMFTHGNQTKSAIYDSLEPALASTTLQ